MPQEFDNRLFRLLKAGLEELTASEKRALDLIWRYPNFPVLHLPTKIGEQPSGSLWLKIGRLAKRKLWDRMPARIKAENQRPGRSPFYSGLLVTLYNVEDRQRRQWAVFELRTEAVRALQDLKVIDKTQRPPAHDHKPLDAFEVKKVPSGFNAPAETTRINRSIIERRGQASFRRDLLAAYGGTCAVTRCTETNVLEAAHIVGFRSRGRYEVANGLLLRADWHTLFDLGLWAIHPKRLTIETSPTISQEYRRYDGRDLLEPIDSKLAPRLDALERRYRRFLRLLPD